MDLLEGTVVLKRFCGCLHLKPAVSCHSWGGGVCSLLQYCKHAHFQLLSLFLTKGVSQTLAAEHQGCVLGCVPGFLPNWTSSV